MNIKHIEQLAKIMRENGLTSVEIAEGDLKINLKKEGQTLGSAVVTDPVIAAMPKKAEVAANESKKADEGYSFSKMNEITSPLAGVFYASPSPDAPPFVKAGDKVKKGDVICIIEAMKIMNELTADRDGEIADVCVKNEQIVEYGQTLFTYF